MLKKIQRRFILAAMAAFGTVMVLIVAGINWANYAQTTSMLDHLAASLLDGRSGHGPREFRPPGKGFFPGRELAGAGPEAEFTTRSLTLRGMWKRSLEIIFLPLMMRGQRSMGRRYLVKTGTEDIMGITVTR